MEPIDKKFVEKETENDPIVHSQKMFYLEKYRRFGENDSRSLSWNDKDSHFLRFESLCNVLRFEKPGQRYSIHEVGCGLAHFIEFISERGMECEYSGSDIVEEFIDSNKRRYPRNFFCVNDITKDLELMDERIKGKDYYILSGTFHTKENNPVEDWESFVFKSIKNMFLLARKVISFNFLTSYSDYYDDKLYYADPKRVLDWILRNLSRFVSIHHDMPLYEFTVCVYKENFFKQVFPNYSRYFKNR